MTLSVLIQQILIIFMEIGIGLTAAKCGIIKESDSKFLSNLVMWVTLPCTLLASTNVSGGRETVLLMLMSFGLLISFYLVCTGVSL